MVTKPLGGRPHLPRLKAWRARSESRSVSLGQLQGGTWAQTEPPQSPACSRRWRVTPSSGQPALHGARQVNGTCCHGASAKAAPGGNGCRRPAAGMPGI